MSVSEKHIAASVAIVDSDRFKRLMATDRIGKCAEMVAEALAAAERKGMKRAAEIVRDSGPYTQDVTSAMICDALDDAALAILSQASEP